MARTTSPVDGRSSEMSASSRLRDSASAGKTSSASKAAVRRLPWPSLRGGRRPRTARPGRAGTRRAAGGGGGAGGGVRRSSVDAGGIWSGSRIMARPSAPVSASGRIVEPPLRRRWTSPSLPLSAWSTRASVSSRPSSATVSKIPGETVVPATATRSGWKTCLRLTPEPLGHAAQRGLHAPPRSTAPGPPSSAARAAASALAPPGARAPARAPAGSSAGPSKKKPRSGQNSRQRLRSCPGRSRPRRAGRSGRSGPPGAR